jgi:diguanylate cyclase (GGDEF)-like protein
MPPAAIPPDETERLKDLHAYGILDSPKEASFDRLTELACGVFGMPMAYISLIDRDRQWCKSSHGFTLDPLGRDSSLCSHTILRPDTLVCEDLREDARFADNPLVLQNDWLRFYAGAPLRTPKGHVVGAFCLLDTKRRTFGREQCRSLEIMAALAVDEMELRRAQAEQDAFHRATERLNEQLLDEASLQAEIMDSIADGVIVTDLAGRFTVFNRSAIAILGRGPSDAGFEDWAREFSIVNADGGPLGREQDPLRRALADETSDDVLLHVNRAEGTRVPLLAAGRVLHDSRGKVRGAVMTFSDFSQLREKEAFLAQQANTDVLTGLANRRALRERLTLMAADPENGFFFMFTDIDHFKRVNDSLGHQAGDEVLAGVARFLGSCQGAFAARFGGEEFCLILPGVDEAAAEAVAERLRAGIEALDLPAKVTASFGLCRFDPFRHANIEQLVRDADSAMYLAKRRGRNQVRIFGRLEQGDSEGQ